MNNGLLKLVITLYAEKEQMDNCVNLIVSKSDINSPKYWSKYKRKRLSENRSRIKHAPEHGKHFTNNSLLYAGRFLQIFWFYRLQFWINSRGYPNQKIETGINFSDKKIWREC